MGGHVIARALEEYPRVYAGALPLCGVLGDNALFDYFLDHQLAAQALSGVPRPPAGVGSDYASAVLPRVYAGLGLVPGDTAVTTPAPQQLRAATVLGRADNAARGHLGAKTAIRTFLNTA